MIAENTQTETEFHSAIDLLLSPDKYFAIYNDGTSTIGGVPPYVRYCVRAQPDVEEGKVVLAMIDYDRLVVGRITRNGDFVTLSPVTGAFTPDTFDTTPQTFESDRVYILGRAVQVQWMIGGEV